MSEPSVVTSATATVPVLPQTHRAVRLHPEDHTIRVETLPIPKIQDPDDAIVKVILAGLCGSDLHAYRGHEEIHSVITTGHEFVGTIVALGSSFASINPNIGDGDVKNTKRPVLYSTLKLGDKVVSPFTSSCAECRFCRLGFTSRCKYQLLFGSEALEGGQAQYVRVPKAGGTLYVIPLSTSSPSKPSASGVEVETQWQTLSNTSLLLLADILPTGCFAALQTVQHPKVLPFVKRVGFPQSSPLVGVDVPGGGVGLNLSLGEGVGGLDLDEEDRVLTVAVVGLGPVGICAIISLLDLLRTYSVTFRLLAIDLNASRRDKIKAVYDALPPDARCEAHGTFAVASPDDAQGIIDGWTEGVGCNAIIEAVGNNAALTLSYALLAPFGLITSVGVHQAPPLPFTGRQFYNKNVAFEFGRCPVRAVFPLAVGLLVRRQDVFGGVGKEEGLVERVVGLGEASEAYRLFSEGVWGKVVFDPWR